MSLDEAGQKVWDLAKIGDATAVQALLDGYSGDTAELVNWVNKDDYERTALVLASDSSNIPYPPWLSSFAFLLSYLLQTK